MTGQTLTFCSQSSFRSSLWGEMLSHSMSKRSILLTACMLARPTSITLFGSTVSSFTLERRNSAFQDQLFKVLIPLNKVSLGMMLSTGSQITQGGGIMTAVTSCKGKNDWLKKLSRHFSSYWARTLSVGPVHPLISRRKGWNSDDESL